MLSMSFDEQTNKQTIMHNNCSVLFTPGRKNKKYATKEHCKHGRMQRDKHGNRKSCVFFRLWLESCFSKLQVYSCVWFTFTPKNLVYLQFLHLSLTVCMSLFYNIFFCFSYCRMNVSTTNIEKHEWISVFTRSFLGFAHCLVWEWSITFKYFQQN